MTDATASWQPDPTGRHDHRYWDGSGWTDHVSDGGVPATDPFEADATPVEPPPVEDPPAVVEPPVEAPTAEAPTAEVPTVAEPTVAEPAVEEPAAEEPAVVEPPIEEPTVEAPTVEAPTVDEPTVEGPAADEPTVDEPTVVDPAPWGAPTTPIVLPIPDPTIEVPAAEVASEPVDESEAEPAATEGRRNSSTVRLAIGVALVAVVCVILAVIVLVDGDDDGPSTAAHATTSTTIPDSLAFSDPSDVSSFQELLANEYERGFGLPRAKAVCLAHAMTDAITKGQVVQGQAASSAFFRNFLDACGVSLDDLNPAAR